MNLKTVRSDFLVALLRYADAEERRRLMERILAAQEEEAWSRRALVICTLVASALCVGLSFLSRDVLAGWEDVSFLLLDMLSALAAFSGFVLIVVSGCWLWNRGTLRRSRGEAARFILGLLESRLTAAEPG